MIEVPDFLPLGSIVKVEGAPKKLMIVSRGLVFQKDDGQKEHCDYGPGADSQNAINAAYSARFAKDSRMNETKGYAVEGGAPRLVHLVSADG